MLGGEVQCLLLQQLVQWGGAGLSSMAWAEAGAKQAGSAGWLSIHSQASCQGKPPHCAMFWSSPRKFLALEASLSEAGRVTALN